MDNSVLMAVVDAAEDLFHEDSCVTFSKLSSLQNLVEQFATFANSNKNEKGTFLLVFCYVLGCQKEKYLEFIQIKDRAYKPDKKGKEKKKGKLTQ